MLLACSSDNSIGAIWFHDIHDTQKERSLQPFLFLLVFNGEEALTLLKTNPQILALAETYWLAYFEALE
jgi:hypothetical protein